MTSSPFADPASPQAIDYQELSGSLLMVEVLGYESGIKTAYTPPGETQNAVRANITVLDGRQAGKVYEDSLVFPKMLIGQLRPRVGRMVLGRLGLGEAKPGMTAPWRLDAATEQDRQRAQAALSSASSSAPGPGPSSPPTTPSEPPF
jgi:hypothetical protein